MANLCEHLVSDYRLQQSWSPVIPAVRWRYYNVVEGGIDGLGLEAVWCGSRTGSYLEVTASQIQHHLVSTLLGFHTLKLKKKFPNSELSA